jgi:CBS domain-containing protein
VLFVSENESAYNVFRLMSDKNLSGVPIVDEDGIWFGNTSGSDLKLYIAHPSLNLLDQSIGNFLSAIRQAETKTRAPTIGVRSTASLWDVVQKLVATKIHRLFVADPPVMKPVAVISLTDLLRCLLPEAVAAHH